MPLPVPAAIAIATASTVGLIGSGFGAAELGAFLRARDGGRAEAKRALQLCLDEGLLTPAQEHAFNVLLENAGRGNSRALRVLLEAEQQRVLPVDKERAAAAFENLAREEGLSDRHIQEGRQWLLDFDRGPVTLAQLVLSHITKEIQLENECKENEHLRAENERLKEERQLLMRQLKSRRITRLSLLQAAEAADELAQLDQLDRINLIRVTRIAMASCIRDALSELDADSLQGVFECPLSFHFMDDPAVLPSGHTVNRPLLEYYYAAHANEEQPLCPWTQVPLPPRLPNGAYPRDAFPPNLVLLRLYKYLNKIGVYKELKSWVDGENEARQQEEKETEHNGSALGFLFRALHNPSPEERALLQARGDGDAHDPRAPLRRP